MKEFFLLPLEKRDFKAKHLSSVKAFYSIPSIGWSVLVDKEDFEPQLQKGIFGD